MRALLFALVVSVACPGVASAESVPALEARVRAHPLVSVCVVVGEGRPFVGALVAAHASRDVLGIRASDG